MKQLFFIGILASVCIFTSCDKSENQISTDDQTTTEENTVVHNPGDDGELTFRVPCVDAYDCEVSITVTSGTSNLTVCGITDGAFSCSGTGCGSSVYPLATTFTSTSFSFCVPHGDSFIVRNNDSNFVTITLTVSGVPLQNQGIAGNSQDDFDIVYLCGSVTNC
jgi:hypothetical protein